MNPHDPSAGPDAVAAAAPHEGGEGAAETAVPADTSEPIYPYQPSDNGGGSAPAWTPRPCVCHQGPDVFCPHHQMTRRQADVLIVRASSLDARQADAETTRAYFSAGQWIHEPPMGVEPTSAHDSTELDAVVTREVARLEAAKNAAYSERNKLVRALAALFPSSLERHPESDTEWEDDWRWIVFIDLPTGQATWHIHDSELPLFAALPRHQGRTWDGHTTEGKYARVAALSGDLGGTRKPEEGA